MRIVILFLVAIPLAAGAETEEDKRKAILEQLGLEKTQAVEEENPAAAEESEPPPKGTPLVKPPGRSAPSSARPVAYAPRVHQLMVVKCQRCHRPEGKAKKSDFLVSGVRETFAAASRYVTSREPAENALYSQAIGKKHKGGKTLKVGGAEEKLLALWIREGAVLGSSRAVAAAKSPVDEEADPPSPPAPLPASAALPSAGEPTREPDEEAPPVASDAADPVFVDRVFPAIQRGCADCHEGEPGEAGFVVTDDPLSTFDSIASRVVPAQPEKSVLLTLPRGAGEHEVVWSEGDADFLAVKAWIETLEVPAAAPSPPVEASPEPSPAAVSEAPRPSGLGDGTLTGRYKKYGIDLPLGFRLNGRFDLNYERRDFEGNPFNEDAIAALRSYHTFLFVSRDPGTDDIPFGISIEAITLQFWEAYFLYEPEALDVRLLLKMGRILVPFGADPLFHNSYGGLAAFDSRVLPVFWAQEGIAANIQWQKGLLSISDDVYVVRGYSLRDPEGRVDLQGGFSPRDDVELGGGNRLGASVGPVSAWYSLYYNGLDGGRRLVMQAFDASVFRPRLPVLEYLSAGVGILRADVSGGGPGVDYYDVGTYWELHAYPLPGLDVRYRQGLRTFDNRRDLVFDERRKSALDGSTHTLGATYRYRGLEVAVHRFWNFEKVDEVPDDFMRFTVAYAF